MSVCGYLVRRASLPRELAQIEVEVRRRPRPAIDAVVASHLAYSLLAPVTTPKVAVMDVLVPGALK